MVIPFMLIMIPRVIVMCHSRIVSILLWSLLIWLVNSRVLAAGQALIQLVNPGAALVLVAFIAENNFITSQKPLNPVPLMRID